MTGLVRPHAVDFHTPVKGGSVIMPGPQLEEAPLHRSRSFRVESVASEGNSSDTTAPQRNEDNGTLRGGEEADRSGSYTC